MKKLVKPVTLAAIVLVSFSLITGCNNKKEETSAPAIEEKDNKEEPVTSEEKPAGREDEMEKLSVSLGNDMGRDITKLSIRPTEEEEWMDIALENELWQSGYLIPVEIDAKTIPNPEKGWFVLLTFAGEEEKLFEGITLNTAETVIFTEDGPVY